MFALPLKIPTFADKQQQNDMNNGNDKLSPQGYRGEEGFGSVLEAASIEAGRILESVQATAGTAYCKGVQIHGLELFAKSNGLWIEDASALGVFSDRGSENEVYMDSRKDTVYKLNDFRYSDDNLTPFFERILAHNTLFPDCSYTLVGFASNSEGKTCAVLSQPFIRADREATIEERAGALVMMGFYPQMDGEYFSNSEYDIFDALPNNVLHGIDGQIYFIDTIIYRSSPKNIDTYKSQSPRYSRKR